MTNLNLNAKTRELTGKKVDQIRKQGKIPAVLYGHNVEPINLMVDYSNFEKIFKEAGESTLIDLVIDEQKPVKVLIQDYQLEPKINQFLHVDFHQIRMDEKLHVEIELKFTGQAPAVKDFNGVLVTSLDKVQAECLPQSLVHEIEVDLSSLKTFDDAIYVADIKVPEGITLLNIPDDVVALVQPPRTEEELEKLEEKPEETKPEGVEEEAEEKEDGGKKPAEEKEKAEPEQK